MKYVGISRFSLSSGLLSIARKRSEIRAKIRVFDSTRAKIRATDPPKQSDQRAIAILASRTAFDFPGKAISRRCNGTWADTQSYIPDAENAKERRFVDSCIENNSNLLKNILKKWASIIESIACGVISNTLFYAFAEWYRAKFGCWGKL